MLKRAEAAECPVLVLLCDTPAFGFRPKEIKNGLSMPPKMSVNNILQIFGKPNWAINTLRYGQPNFEVLKPYMPKGLDLKQLGTTDDCGFSPFGDDISTTRETAFKKIRARVKGTALAAKELRS